MWPNKKGEISNFNDVTGSIQNSPLFIRSKFKIHPFLLGQNSEFTPFYWVKIQSLPLLNGSKFECSPLFWGLFVNVARFARNITYDKSFSKFTWPFNRSLKRFVKKVFNTSCDSHHQSKWISNDIQTENDDVSLLDGLAGIMSHHFLGQIFSGVKVVLSLKVS